MKTTADADHAKIWARLEAMDDHGTRGVQGLTVRMDNLIGDVADLKSEVKTDVGALQAEVSTRFAAHQKVHDDDAKDRVTGRRYALTTVIAVVAIIVGLLLNITLHLR
jgi:hypothetical protein